MDGTIKPAEKENFVCVHLFSGDVLLFEGNIDKIFSVLQNGSKFVKISGNVVNINEIKFVEPYIPNDIEIFIATQTDPRVKKELKKIYDERNSKGLETAGTEHLRKIYTTRKN